MSKWKNEYMGAWIPPKPVAAAFINQMTKLQREAYESVGVDSSAEPDYCPTCVSMEQAGAEHLSGWVVRRSGRTRGKHRESAALELICGCDRAAPVEPELDRTKCKTTSCARRTGHDGNCNTAAVWNQGGVLWARVVDGGATRWFQVAKHPKPLPRTAVWDGGVLTDRLFDEWRRAQELPTGVSVTYSSAPMTARATAPDAFKLNPLDAVIDGMSLRDLLGADRHRQRHDVVATLAPPWPFTPAQRAAVSAYWSAQLRAKVSASEAKRILDTQITYSEVEPWE